VGTDSSILQFGRKGTSIGSETGIESLAASCCADWPAIGGHVVQGKVIPNLSYFPSVGGKNLSTFYRWILGSLDPEKYSN
jgi:hypothetical protein